RSAGACGAHPALVVGLAAHLSDPTLPACMCCLDGRRLLHRTCRPRRHRPGDVSSPGCPPLLSRRHGPQHGGSRRAHRGLALSRPLLGSDLAPLRHLWGVLARTETRPVLSPSPSVPTPLEGF